MIPTHLIPTRKFADGDQISDDPMRNDVFTVKTMEWNHVLNDWVYEINDGQGNTRWVEVSDCHRDYNQIVSHTLKLPVGLEFIPVNLTINDVKISCDHSWRSSSSEEGKTHWCSTCGERK